MHADIWPPLDQRSFVMSYAGTSAGVWAPLPEADLLVIVDGLSVDTGVVVWDQANLPADLELVALQDNAIAFTQYQFQASNGDFLSLLTVSAEQWQMPLGQRLTQADAEFNEVA